MQVKLIFRFILDKKVWRENENKRKVTSVSLYSIIWMKKKSHLVRYLIELNHSRKLRLQSFQQIDYQVYTNLFCQNFKLKSKLTQSISTLVTDTKVDNTIWQRSAWLQIKLYIGINSQQPRAKKMWTTSWI